MPPLPENTLIRHLEVSPFADKKTPSDFDTKTLTAFDAMGREVSYSLTDNRVLDAYDFYCTGCNRPVRLLYDEQERGIGGQMRAVVHRIIEQKKAGASIRWRRTGYPGHYGSPYELL